MAESTTSKENLLLPKETHKVDTDDIKMNPKRSRDNMSEDESNDKCIKKPRQEINTEIFHPNTDNNNENKSIIVMNDTDKNNDILEKKSAVQDLSEKKQSEITFEKCENMEIDEDKKSSNDNNSTLDNSNNVTEEGKHGSINDPELSIKCVSDNNSLESEKNEKKMKLKQNTDVVEDTIKDFEVETSVLESKLSENSEKHEAEKTENEEIKLLKSSKSDDDEDDNDSNNYENVGGVKSMQKNKITGENLKKITKKKGKSAQDDEKHNQNDSNIYDKSSSSEKCESSTDDDSDGLKNEDCHQIKTTKSKLNVSRKKAAIKLSKKRNNSHDVTVKEKINCSDDEMIDTDNENEDASLKNKINRSDIDQNESPKTMANSEESNDDDINGEKNPKKGETKKKNSKFDDEIARLKKYIHAAGIKVKKYDDLWSNCKSNKQKIDRLKLLLEENGISGRPTLQKCEMAKAKREQDREIAELDPKNIISEARITRSMKNCSKKSSTSSSSKLSSLPQQKIRNRIQIVDSDSE